ncbi:MAG: hypothetical protein MZW92_38280 [Comamonadaceae bacterium]|nr:hypothetical protein [Comamonadaceae bacterium]
MLEKLGLDRTLLPLLRWTQRKLVRYTTVPAEAEKIAFDRGQPVCYALHVRQLSSLLVLEEAAEQLGLPRPWRRWRSAIRRSAAPSSSSRAAASRRRCDPIPTSIRSACSGSWPRRAATRRSNSRSCR